MKAIRIHTHGGPDVLQYEDVDVPQPGEGQVLVKVGVAGLNFIDVYFRTGANKPPSLPFTQGMEAAGTVAALGPGVTGLSVGDRVAYAMVLGAFAEYAVVPAWRLATLPDAVSLEDGAAVMLQGMTAHYLTTDTFAIRPGHTALVHAAAGGAGLMLTQVAKLRGARVIATVGTEAKADLARKAGADDVILYTSQDFEVEVKRLTDGKGVDVVYDSVGETTFLKGLNCLRPRGYMVLFGASSGQVAPMPPALLAGKGSLFLTRPTLAHYAATRDEVVARSSELFGWLAARAIALRIESTRPLAEAAQAQRDLEARKTTGKILLKP